MHLKLLEPRFNKSRQIYIHIYRERGGEREREREGEREREREDITRWREDMNCIFEWQNNILRTSAASKTLFLPRENNIHIFKPPCNVLFII